jgi:predicted ester cyclase
MRGTQRGEFNGMPATGKSFTISGVSIWEVRGNLLIQEWVNWDALGMMQQLGVIPAPMEAAR